MTARAALLALACLGAAGCSPTFSNGGLSCASDGSCPPNFHCASDRRCWKNGQDPIAGGGDMSSSVDLGAPLALGDTCQNGGDCASGFCVDGVCCDGACSGACQACALAGTVGHCTNVAAGAMPSAGHPSCGPDAASTCMRDGTCDGSGACHLWNNVVCKPGSCDSASNQATAAAKCDGKGTCVVPNPIVCDPYVCLPDHSACYPSCSGASTGCKPPASCTNASCGPKVNGTPCSAGAECATNNCSPDGYCCDKPCTGKCEACDVGINRGTCTPLTSGQPETSHGGNCAGFGTSCGGACASGNVASCTFPTLQCVAASCNNGVATMASSCDGAGTCPTASTMNCTPYVCGPTACKASCAADGDCIGNDFCCVSGMSCFATMANKCLAKYGDGSACTTASQCMSGSCTAFYVDGDRDGYGVAPATTFCGTLPPSGYAANNTDCCDTDANAHPGQTSYFTVKDACGSWDYNCNGIDDLQYAAAFSGCSFANVCGTGNGNGGAGQGYPCMNYASGGTPGWGVLQSANTVAYVPAMTIPACGQGGTYIASCGLNTQSSPPPTACGVQNYCQFNAGPQTQACR